MNTTEIISQLEKQRDAIGRAIAALTGSRPKFRRRRRKLSAVARERIAAAQRKRWRQFKKK
jgi:hypothetical protein